MADADAATAGACRSVTTWCTNPSDETIREIPIYSSTGVETYTAASTNLDLAEGFHAFNQPFPRPWCPARAFENLLVGTS
jgi:hypothetical protein